MTIKKLEIIEDYIEGVANDSFDFGWLDLNNARAEEAISNRFGLMQRKINELIDFANSLANKSVKKLSTEEEQLQHTKVLAEMARLLPKTVADQLDKVGYQGINATDQEVLISLLERERIVLNDKCHRDWDAISMARLNSVERLIKSAKAKEKP